VRVGRDCSSRRVAAAARQDNGPRILDFIYENPGCHLRKIRKELDLAMGTVQYQLDKLDKAGMRDNFAKAWPAQILFCRTPLEQNFGEHISIAVAINSV